MATIKDVARLAGVSVATVSRVINHSPKTSSYSCRRVEQAMLQLNYYPNANARALAQQSTETLGLLVPDVSDPFFGTMIKAIDQIANQTGNFLLLVNGYHCEQQEKKAIEQLLRHQCKALVVHARKINDNDLKHFMQQSPAMVLINRILKGFEHRCVALDDEYGIYLAVRYLIQQNHKNIAWINANNAVQDSINRQQGYKNALADHHLSINPILMVDGEPDETGGEQAMIALLNSGHYFSAVACYNDSMAAGALIALTDNGLKVPEQISIMGFDDILVSRYVRPRLTTVRYPLVIMAQQAAQLAIALANNSTPPDVTPVFQPTLVIRNSVSCYRDNIGR